MLNHSSDMELIKTPSCNEAWSNEESLQKYSDRIILVCGIVCNGYFKLIMIDLYFPVYQQHILCHNAFKFCDAIVFNIKKFNWIKCSPEEWGKKEWYRVKKKMTCG